MDHPLTQISACHLFGRTSISPIFNTDHITESNTRIWGRWFDDDGNATPFNPLQITKVAFKAQYMSYEEDEEDPELESSDLPTNDTPTIQQPVGTGPTLPSADGSSSNNMPARSFKDFKASSLTDGTFRVKQKYDGLVTRLLDGKGLSDRQPNDYFDEMEPGLFAILPGGIDLTTVEILTFFPGYLKDPFFLYRCTAAGWSATSLKTALFERRNEDINEGTIYTAIQTRLRVNLVFVTGDNKATIMAYKRLSDNERSVVTDYTNNGFAMTWAASNGYERKDRATEEIRRDDLTLAQVYNNGARIRQMPQGNDAGTLTALIMALKQDPENEIKSLTMSQIASHVANNTQMTPVTHTAVDDKICANFWEKENKKRKDAEKSRSSR